MDGAKGMAVEPFLPFGALRFFRDAPGGVLPVDGSADAVEGVDGPCFAAVEFVAAFKAPGKRDAAFEGDFPDEAGCDRGQYPF